jgi:hypothetical protein
MFLSHTIFIGHCNADSLTLSVNNYKHFAYLRSLISTFKSQRYIRNILKLQTADSIGTKNTFIEHYVGDDLTLRLNTKIGTTSV